MSGRGVVSNSKTRIIWVGFFFFIIIIIFFSIHQYFRWWFLGDFFFTNNAFPLTNTEKLEEKRISTPPPSSLSRPSPLIWCDRSHLLYDVCTLSGTTVMDPATSTFLITAIGPNQTTQTIRPYPGKWNKGNMLNVKELTFGTTTTPTGTCHHSHNAPALVFSTGGGLIGNIFHDFGDVLVPLFITLHLFFYDKDPPVFVVTDYRDWWLPKYNDILRHLTPHPVIFLDKETSTHCFPSTHLGLVSHCYLSVDPALMPHSESIHDFHALLDRSYYYYSGQFIFPATKRPRLVLARRRVGRIITNHDDLVRIAEKVGFDVVNFEPNQYMPLREIYKMINSSHALFGVHGAALTHMLFLRPGSVLIQVVPIGIDWLAEICFGKVARQLGLEYMDYKIRVEESSLPEKYRRADFVLKEQERHFWEIYLGKQDVTLDLVRVRSVLEKAFHKAKIFMDKEG